MSDDESSGQPPTVNRAVNVFLALLMVATVVAVSVGLVRTKHHRHATSSAVTSTTSARTAPAPSVPSGTTTASKSAEAVNPDPQRTQLFAELRQFVSTYSLILPADRAADRRFRTKPLATADAMQLLDFNIHESAAIHARRLRENLTVKGSVDLRPRQILVQPENTTGTLLYVYARVSVELYRSTVAVGAFQPPYTSVSLWQYTAAKWQLLSYSEGGN